MSRFSAPALTLAAVLAIAPSARDARADAQSGFGSSTGGGLAAEDEAFRTELFSGAATSSLPFLLPPGPNGFQPGLGLRYDSQSGNGWVGRGWQLAVPAIERMTKYGAPSYSDAPASGDAFALSDDRLVRDDAGVYHAMRENFARIERVDANGVIDSWVVRRTNGETQYFGSTPDSRVTNAANRPLRWLLSRSEDANGNFVRYVYATPAETGDDGTPYLKQILYGAAGDVLGSTTIRTVDFALGVRPDATISYRAGVRMEMSRRLETVTVRYGGALVTRYELVYADEDGLAPASGASLLRRVRRVGADGTSALPYDVFSYAGGALPAWSSDPALGARLGSLTIGSGAAQESFRLDDGNWVLADANGDGAPDVLATKNNVDQTLDEAVYLNDRAATAFRASRIPSPYVLHLQAAVSNEATRLVDYDGDGRLDILFSLSTPQTGWVDATHSNYLYEWLPEDRPGYAYPPVPMADFCSFNGGFGPNVGWTVVVDVDGDALPDLVHDAIPGTGCTGARSRREVYLNTGAGWEASPDAAWSASLSNVLTGLNAQVAELFFFDLNGDGLLDVAKDANHDGALDGTAVYVNDQTGWRADSGFAVVAGFRPVDLNGDGLPDHAGANAQLNRGTALGGATFTLPASFGTPGSGRTFADVDGDGLVDLVEANGSTPQVYRASAAVADHLLTHIDRATGATIDLSYLPTTGGSCYDAAGTGYDFDRAGCNADPLLVPAPGGSLANCTYPLFAWATISGTPYCGMPYELLPFAVQTVDGVTVDDRNGNVRSDRARFTHGLYDAYEREFRGFGRVIERPQTMSYTSPKGGTVSLASLRVTQFYQYSFLRGQIASLDLWSSSDDVLDEAADPLVERTVNAYAFTRGDMTGTYLLMGTSILTSGNALACDPTLAGGGASCLYDLQQDPYATSLALPAPLPFAPFQNAFCNAEPTNRDCVFAYLVLPVGSQTGSYDTSAPYVTGSLRWHDAHGNVQAEWSRGDLADATDDRVEVRQFAAPASGAAATNYYGAPSRRYQQNVTGVIQADTRFDYDSLPNGQVSKGRVTAVVQVLKDSVNALDTTVTTTAVYSDANAGLPHQVSDPFQAGATPRYTVLDYDAGRSFVRVELRGSLYVTTTYDPPGAPPGLGLVRFVDDANARRTTYGADVFGRPTSVSGPAPLATTELRVYFDTQGLTSNHRMRLSTFDGRGNEVQVRTYTDGLGRTIRTESTGLDENDAPAAIRRETRYDRLGRVSFEGRPSYTANPQGVSTYYDLRGRPRFRLHPDGGVEETVYDGLLTTSYDAANGRTDVLRDGAGSVTRVTQYPQAGQAQSTRYVYDPLGRLQLVCDPLAASCGFAGGGGLPVAADPKHTIVIGYDWLSRRVRLVDPDLGESRYRYDGAGNLVYRSDPKGAMSYGYDTLGRLTYGADSSSGSPTDASFDLTYGDELASAVRPANSLGRVALRSDWAQRRFEYDAAGRVTRLESSFAAVGEPQSPTYVFQYGYDDQGRVTSITHPDGEVITQSYDLMGLDRVGSSLRSYVSDLRHDAEGHVRVMTYGNGDVRELTYQATTGYLSTLTGRPASGAAFLSRTFGYDLAGRVASLTDGITASESLTGISYDQIGRLKQLARGGTSLLYEYDPLGNLTRKDNVALPFQHATRPHALYDGANPARFQYDAAGNQVARDGQTLEYDSLSRLVSVSGSLRTTYRYDYAGERVVRQRGADLSYYAGPDYEIKNRRRAVKTIRVAGVVVAQVAVMLPPSGAAAPWLRSAPIDPAPLAAALAALALAAAAAGAASRGARVPAWQRALASGLAVAVVALPALPALAATKGDVRIDGQLNPGDAVLLMRSLTAGVVLSTEQRTAADVAPLVAGQATGDGRVDAADLRLLGQAASGADADGDGLSGSQEAALHLWPLLRDSDGDGTADDNEDSDADGVANSSEIAQGFDPANPDSDADGYVDGDDPEPLSPAGTLVAYVHADHLGSAAVMTSTAGVVVRRISYGVFGDVRSNTRQGPPSTLDPAQKFTSQQLDDDTGLYYYGARYYDASYGRFTSADGVVPNPLDPQSLNRYAYVRGDPLRATDPSGHDPLWDYGIGDWGWDNSGDSLFDLLDLDDDFMDYDYDVDWGWDMGFPDLSDASWGIWNSGLTPGWSDAWSWSFRDVLYAYDLAPSTYRSDTMADLLIATHEDFRLMVATVYGEACASSEVAWAAVGNVIMNRVDSREWSSYDTPGDVIRNSGFDAYTFQNGPFRSAWADLNGESSNPVVRRMAEVLSPIYLGISIDITDGAVLYYSPAAQSALHQRNPQMYPAQPRWNFGIIERVDVPGLAPSDDFRFYRYP
jgi:RHS repeat-associated protein